MKTLKRTVLVMFTSAIISSCAMYDTVSGNKGDEYHAEGEALIKDAYKHVPKERELSHIKFDDDFFVPKQTPNENYPDWFYAPIDLNKTSISLNRLMTMLQTQEGIVARAVEGAKLDKEFPLNFQGRWGEALQKVSFATGYGIEFDESSVTWSSFVTRSIPVSMPPSTQSFRIGEDSQSQTSDTGGFSLGQQTQKIDTKSYANVEVDKLSPWESFIEAIKVIKSPEGSINYDRSTSILLVKDYPNNARSIQTYVESHNSATMTNVAFDFTIIEFSKTKGVSAGIDWDLAATDLALKNINGTASLVTGFASSIVNSVAPLTLGLEATSGKLTGTQLLIEALEKQGVVTVSTRPRVFASHNKMSRVELGSDRAYAASSGVSSNQVSQQSGLETATLSLGTDISIVPTVLHGKDELFIELGLDLVDLAGLPSFESDGVTVQLPETNKKKLMMQFSARSGETILISGNKSARKEYKSEDAGLLTWLFGGARSSSEDYSEVLILITPRILNRWGR